MEQAHAVEDLIGRIYDAAVEPQLWSETIAAVAGRYCEGRIVSVLEGGYELHALGRSVAAHLKVLGEL